MSCGLDKDKLTGYFDGELDAAERSEVELHIGVCSECLRELEEIKSASVTIRGLPRYAVPAAVTEAILREVARGSAEIAVLRPKPRPWMPWALTAAAAVFVAVNVIYFTALPRRSNPLPPASDVALRPGTGETPKAPGLESQAQKKTDSNGESRARGGRAEGKEASDKPGDTVMSRTPKQAPPFYSVVSSDIAEARTQVEHALRDMGVVYSTGAGEFDQSSYAKDTCIEVVATDEQLVALGSRMRESGERMVWAEGAEGFRPSNRGGLAEKDEPMRTLSGDGPGTKQKGLDRFESETEDAESREPKKPSSGGESPKAGIDKKAAKEEERTMSAGPAGKKLRAVIFFHELQSPKSGK